jgi:hypothetical protein
MKIQLAIGLVLLSAASLSAQDRKVAFSLIHDTGVRYLTTPANGGLGLSRGDLVTSREVFLLEDLNGGELETGDTVKVRWEKTCWSVTNNAVRRVSTKGANEDLTIFEVKKVEDKYRLKTNTGQWIGYPTEDNVNLQLTDVEDTSLLLEVVADPVPDTP